MGQKSRRIVWWVFVLALASTLIVLLALRRTGNRVAVTISKETTYITEPLREDGYPDYVAALNNRMSEGVTPENNASVLLWQAIGPGEINANDREKYFQMLGIPPLPENGDYYITPDKYLARRKDPKKPAGVGADEDEYRRVWDQLELAMRRPWAKDEFPVLAGWLEANERPLALLVQASLRPRRYDPMICEKKRASSVIVMPSTADNYYRHFCSALAARAMLRLGAGKPDDAWDDLLVCHRLTRVVDQGVFAVEAAVVTGIERGCFANDQAFLRHARLSADQATRMLTDLSNLRPVPALEDKIEFGERFADLDRLLAEAAGGTPSIQEPCYEGSHDLTPWNSLTERLGRTAVNWNVVLRTYNSTFDQVVEALHRSTRSDRKTALGEVFVRLGYNEKFHERWQSLVWSTIVHGRRATSLEVARNRLILGYMLFSPDFDIQDRTAMQLDLTKLAFALAAYHADHGSYPAKLDELAPKYVPEIPKDIFADTDLRYKREGDGYLLYSVGVNGKDDGGRGEEDREQQENSADGNAAADWDDLVVRMPAAAEAKEK